MKEFKRRPYQASTVIFSCRPHFLHRVTVRLLPISLQPQTYALVSYITDYITVRNCSFDIYTCLTQHCQQLRANGWNL